MNVYFGVHCVYSMISALPMLPVELCIVPVVGIEFGR